MEALSGKTKTVETYIAGLGARGALIAGAVVVALLLIGLVAFDAFPRAAGLLGGDDDRPDAADASAPADGAATAVGPSADLVADATPGTPLIGGAGDSGAADPGGGGSPGGSAQTGGGTGTPGAGGSAHGAVGDTTSAVGGTVGDTVNGDPEWDDYTTLPPPPPSPPPTADFTRSPSGAVIPPGTTNFTRTATCPEAPCTYRWHHNTTTFGTGPTATFNYVCCGQVNASMTVTDSLGRANTVVKSFKIEEPLPPPPPPPPPPSSSFLTPPAGTPVSWTDDLALNPLPEWGGVVCASNDNASDRFTYNLSEVKPGRIQHFTTGGPDGGAYRAFTAFDGDQMWGERCAAGENSQPTGPTVKYNEGEYHLTTGWVRIGPSINYTAGNWRQIIQTKQTQPYNEPGPSSMFEIQLRSGVFLFQSRWVDLWSTPVTCRCWIPISWEGFYTQDASQGWWRIRVGNVTSPVFNRATLLRETDGTTIPSHLQVGMYHDAALPTETLDVGRFTIYGN